jgi:AbrB family looped-hinge helix DNA binding protein
VGVRTTVDKAGRLVIPKRLRDEVGLRPGQQVRIDVVGTALLVQVAEAEEPAVEERGGRLVVGTTGARLTAADVDALRDGLRR